MPAINEISVTTGIPVSTLFQIKENIFSFPSVEDAVIYGSRALGNWKKFSDIDISLIGENVSHNDLITIMFKLEDLDIPYIVDLNRFASLTNPALIDHITRVGISLK